MTSSPELRDRPAADAAVGAGDPAENAEVLRGVLAGDAGRRRARWPS